MDSVGCVGVWGVGFRNLRVCFGVGVGDFGLGQVGFGLGREGCEMRFWGSGWGSLGWWVGGLIFWARLVMLEHVGWGLGM